MTSINLNRVTLWQASFYYSIDYFVTSCSLLGEVDKCWWLFIHRFKAIGNNILSSLNNIQCNIGVGEFSYLFLTPTVWDC